MASRKITMDTVEIHKKSSFISSVVRKDGLDWTDTETAEYEVFNQVGEAVGIGTLTKSDDNKSFELVIPSDLTTKWDRKKKYLTTIRVVNSENGFNSVVREIEFIVK